MARILSFRSALEQDLLDGSSPKNPSRTEFLWIFSSPEILTRTIFSSVKAIIKSDFERMPRNVVLGRLQSFELHDHILSNTFGFNSLPSYIRRPCQSNLPVGKRQKWPSRVGEDLEGS